MSYINKKLRAFQHAGDLELHRKRSDGRMKTYLSAIDARVWSINREDRRQHFLDLIKQGDGKGLSLGKYIPIDAIIDILLANKNADINRLQQEIEELKRILKEHGIYYEEKPISVVEPVSSVYKPRTSEVEVIAGVRKKRSLGEPYVAAVEEEAEVEAAAAALEEGAFAEAEPVEGVVAEAAPPGEEFATAEEGAIAEAAPEEAGETGEAAPEEEGVIGTAEPEEGYTTAAEADDEESVIAEAPPEEADAAAEKSSKASSHPSRAGEIAAAAEVKVSKTSSGARAVREKKTSSDSISGMQMEVIIVPGGQETETPIIDGRKPMEESEFVEGVVQYDEVSPMESAPTERGKAQPQYAGLGDADAFYKALAIEAIQQLENIKNIVEGGDGQTRSLPSSLAADQPRSSARKSKESVKSGTDSRDSVKLPTIGEEGPEVTKKSSTDHSTKRAENGGGKSKDSIKSPGSHKSKESIKLTGTSKESTKSGEESKFKSTSLVLSSSQPRLTGTSRSKESVKFEDEKIIKSVPSEPSTTQQAESGSPTSEAPAVAAVMSTSPPANDIDLRRRFDSLKGLEDDIRGLRDMLSKSMHGSGDNTEKDRLLAQVDECEMKLKELDILKIEKNCLKGRCKDLEGIQREYEDLLKRTQGFDTLKAQCSMYKSKYDEMVKLSEENVDLQAKIRRADTLEKERETLLQEIEDCECCINKQENELKKLTHHVDCLSEELDKQKDEGKTRTMTIKARLKRQDLMPIFHDGTSNGTNGVTATNEGENSPCEGDCLRSRIEELETEIKQMKNEGNDYKSDIDVKEEGFKQELAAKDTSYQVLQESFKAMESNYNALDSNYKALEANYKTLEEKYKALENDYAEFETKHKASEAKYKELEAKYEAASGEYNALKSEYKTSEANYKKLDSSYKSMEIKNDALETAFKQLQDSRKLLEDNIKTLQTNNKVCLENLVLEKNNSRKLAESLHKAIKNDEHLKQMLKQTKCAIKCITVKLKQHEIVGPGQLEQQRNDFCKKIQELQKMTEVPCGAEKITELEDELTTANATIKCLRDNLDQLKNVMDENSNLGELAVKLQDQQLKPFGPALIK